METRLKLRSALYPIPLNYYLILDVIKFFYDAVIISTFVKVRIFYDMLESCFCTAMGTLFRFDKSALFSC